MAKVELTTKPWAVSVQPAPAHSSHPGPVYRVTGPELADPGTAGGILLSNKEDAYAMAAARELLWKLADIIDFYEYVDALSPEVIKQAQVVIDMAKGKFPPPPRPCGIPGCPNTALEDSIQIGPGTNVYVCCTCADVI